MTYPWLASIALALLLTAMLSSPVAATGDSLQHRPGPDTYHAPLAGEGYKTTVFGKAADVAPLDRRAVTAWDLGLAYTPSVDGARLLPVGALYLRRNPDNQTYLSGQLAGVFNHIFYARSPTEDSAFEGIFTWENFTLPIDQGEYIDGERQDDQELAWGYIRAGVGLGYRQHVAPYNQDNMRAVALTLEPGYYLFDNGEDVAASFEEPRSTFETRIHLRFRWDALQRNILELAHQGFAAGADVVLAHRTHWDNWGLDGANDGDEHQDYGYVTAYGRLAGDVPGVASERHRLLASLHAGAGQDLDRFSAPRVGGGPQSDEYSTLSRPVIPGALLREFFPDHYAILTGEYRFAPVFFSYLGVRGSFAWVDRGRLRDDDIDHDNELLTSLGTRWTTGFFFNTRLQIEYNYNFGLVRDGDRGGQNVIAHLSAQF